jgi:predicted TIM-barrel fold metal-dependent hydrolase
MEIVDAQIHGTHRGLEQSVAIMDALGVSAAVLDDWPPTREKTPDGINRYRFPFSEEAVRRFPDRFAYVMRFDPSDPEIDSLVAGASKTVGCVSLRIASGLDFKVMKTGGHGKVLDAALKHKMPVMIYPGDEHRTLTDYVRKYPGIQFIIDHIGMGVERAALPNRLETTIEALLAYTQYPNVAVKWGHAPRLSRAPFPYPDLLAQLRRVIDAFGVNRIMWASDFTVTTDHHSYGESLFCIRCADNLSDDEKEWLLGKTVRSILKWPKAA